MDEQEKNNSIPEQDDLKFLGAQTDNTAKSGKNTGRLKKFMPIILLLSVAVVLFAGVFVLKAVLPEKPAETTDTDKTVKIYDFNGTGAERMEIKNDLDTYAFVRKSEKTYYIDGKADLPLDSSKALAALTLVGELSAESVIDENPTDLAQYGLDKPVSTVTWQKKDETYTVMIGNQTPSGNYYMKTADGNKVYSYSSDNAVYFISPRFNYYSTKLYTFSIDDDAPYVNLFKIGKKGEDTIEVHYREVDEDSLLSSYQIVEPIEHDFSSTRASYIMAFIAESASLTVCDDDLSAENLKQYGLDAPEYTFMFRNVAEEHTMYFGKLSDKGYRYVYTDENKFVYIIDADAMNTITLTIADYCEEMSYNRSYDTVDSITIDGAGKHYDLKITGTAKDESLKAYVNNKYVEYENFSDLYAHIISIGIKGVGERKPDSKLLATVTFKCLDGTVDVLKYYEKDEIESYFELNGKGRLLVSTKNVEEITEFAQKLYDGEEITLEW